jgi:hypothetical protein
MRVPLIREVGAEWVVDQALGAAGVGVATNLVQAPLAIAFVPSVGIKSHT